MRAGSLRDRIRIQNDTSTDNDPEASYSDLYVNEPAQITDVAAGETFRGRQLEPHVKAMVVMRYRSDVDEQCKIVCQSHPFDGTTYNITGIKVQRQGSRPVGLELECST